MLNIFGCFHRFSLPYYQNKLKTKNNNANKYICNKYICKTKIFMKTNRFMIKDKKEMKMWTSKITNMN